ncbi:MAG: FAD-dependent oxidoreductase [Clostridia bacterium]|nr:FAD-dependent oxidoreductase [Clostridia bacterium]
MEKLWIDAVDFDDYGGFILETQFIREMGQPYLMANGVGEAVSPAEASFTVKGGGTYRFFIRTKNWCAEHNPDGLVLEVDGMKSRHVCSEMRVNGWYFEIGADFILTPGKHTLKIYDTKGWFARFSCVVITNDYDFMPSRELKALERQRNEIKGLALEVSDKGSFDLIVVGAGVGGIVAAITAARYGLKTALINDRPKLGGNAAEESNVVLEGAAHRGYHEMGVVFEIKNYKHAHNTSWSSAFEKFTSQEENLEVFSDMLLIDAVTNNNSITEIFTLDTHSLAQYKFSADTFVDGTGDGWLGYYAGAAYRIGREAKFQHNESFAPDAADGNTMSGSATGVDTDVNKAIFGYLAEETAEAVDFKAPDWAFKLPEGEMLGRVPSRLERGEWWLEMPNDYDDLFENEYVRDSMLRMAVGYFDWMKNSWSEREKAKSFRLKSLGTYNAKRESRRLIGDYILTENDYVENQSYFDSISYCGWNIDVHHVCGIFSGVEGKFTANKKIPITPIPFGTLYSKNINNLMMVGRCISATHIGLGPVRVQLTTGTMGQAVSTAAYLCKKYGKNPRAIRNEHIGELQQLLIKDGLYIPGVCHNDPNDLAKGARVSATSHAPGGEPSNVINGKIWKKDGSDYAWISSGDLPESITLEFDAPRTVSQVRLTFDTPFNKYKYGYMEQPLPKELVTDFSLSLLKNGKWTEVKLVNGNIQRLAVLNIEPTVAKAIKITVLKTFDCKNAVISEIRAY